MVVDEAGAKVEGFALKPGIFLPFLDFVELIFLFHGFEILKLITNDLNSLIKINFFIILSFSHRLLIPDTFKSPIYL